MKAITIAVAAILAAAQSASAADGWWVDQYSLMIYTATGQLDNEFAQIKREGSSYVLLHSDTLPNPYLEFVASRAKAQGLQSIAWVQRPTVARLDKVGQLDGFKAVQVDDHFFAAPVMTLDRLRKEAGGKEVWCSFQPGQYNWSDASQCDHYDVQVYRQSCQSVADSAYIFGMVGNPRAAIATYHNGGQQGKADLNCLNQRAKDEGFRVFAFKWKNPEARFAWLASLLK